MSNEPTDKECRRYIELSFISKENRCEKEQAEYNELAKKVRGQISFNFNVIQVFPEDKERFEALCDGRTSPEGFTRLLDGKLTQMTIGHEEAVRACRITENMGIEIDSRKMAIFLKAFLYKG